MSSVPKSLRACFVCGFVQASSKFIKSGCPNCDEFLEIRGSSDVMMEATSAVFEGLVTINDTNSSWVAKWQRLVGYVPGVYAIKINGLLSEELADACEAAGVKYIPRDGSADADEQ